MRTEPSKPSTDSRVRRDAERDALCSCGGVEALLRAELARSNAGRRANELERAIAILAAAEGVRTADATLVLECEKPGDDD